MKKYNQSHGKVNKEKVKVANREDELEAITEYFSAISQANYKVWKSLITNPTEEMRLLDLDNRINVMDFTPKLTRTELYRPEFIKNVTNAKGIEMPIYEYVSLMESLTIFCMARGIRLPYAALEEELTKFTKHVLEGPNKYVPEKGFFAKVKNLFKKDFKRKNITDLTSALVSAPEFIFYKRLKNVLTILMASKGDEVLKVNELELNKFFKTDTENLDTLTERIEAILPKVDKALKFEEKRKKDAEEERKREKEERETPTSYDDRGPVDNKLAIPLMVGYGIGLFAYGWLTKNDGKSLKELKYLKGALESDLNVIAKLKRIDTILYMYKDELRVDDESDDNMFTQEEVDDFFRFVNGIIKIAEEVTKFYS